MKNLKHVLMNLLLLVCPVLLFVFMSQPYLTVSAGILGGGSSNGYEFIDFGADGVHDFHAVCLILLCIFAGILIVTSLVSLLGNFGVLKTKKYEKLIGGIKIASVLVLLITTVVSLSVISSEFVTGSTIVAGWAVIVNMVLAILLTLGYTIYLVSNLMKRK